MHIYATGTNDLKIAHQFIYGRESRSMLLFDYSLTGEELSRYSNPISNASGPTKHFHKFWVRTTRAISPTQPNYYIPTAKGPSSRKTRQIFKLPYIIKSMFCRKHTTMRNAWGSSSRSLRARSKISNGSNSWVHIKNARFAQVLIRRSCR